MVIIMVWDASHYELNQTDWSFFVAATDMRLKQYYIVHMHNATEVGLCNATDTPLGILQNKPNVGEVAMVRVKGISKVRVNAAGLAAEAQYGSDANGRAIAVTTDKGIILGQCFKAGTAVEDDIATVTVNGGILHTISKT